MSSAAFLVTCTLAPLAFAQSKASTATVQDDSRATAAALMRRGTEEYKRGAMEAARASFTRAWEIEQHPAIAANLADAEMRLGQYREAAEHWSFYLRNAPPERDRSEAQRALDLCRKHVAEINVAAEEKAVVSLDGKRLGEAPLPSALWVEPGLHVLEARSAGGRLATQQVQVVSGETKHVALVPAATPVPKFQASEGSLPSTHAANRADRSDAKATIFEKRTTSARGPILVGGTALTALAFGLGAFYGLKAQSASNEAGSLAKKITSAAAAQGEGDLVGDAIVCNTSSAAVADDCAALRAKVDAARSSRSRASVAFGAAGVLAAGTLVTYLVWPGSRSSSAAWTFGPWRSKGGGSGVTVEGTF